MEAKPTTKRTVSAGLRLDQKLASEAHKIAASANLRISDLLRIGLTRLIADVRKNKGKLVLGREQ